MNIAVVELEFLFFMLPDFEVEASEIWDTNDTSVVLQDIADNLYKGDHIGANIWKLRLPAKGKGKRGGARIIYLQLNEDRIVLLLEAYAKGDKEDLTPQEEEELVEFARTLDIQGVVEDGKETARKLKAKAKDRGGFQQRKPPANAAQTKSKGSGHKKDKRKR